MLLKRPLFCVCASFVAGMYLLLFFEIGNIMALAIGIAFVFLVMLIRNFSVRRVFLLTLCLLLLCCGSALFYTTDNIKTKELYGYLEQDITIKAEIVSKPVADSEQISFVGRVISADGKSLDSSEKLIFKYYAKEDVLIDVENVPKNGDVISVPGKVSIPNGPMNTGGFDYAKYLKSDKIFFICDMEYEMLELKAHINRPFTHGVENFRTKCTSFFDEVFPEKEAAVLKAFVVGDKSSIDSETRLNFSKSGLSHVLAVSGLHVTSFIGIIAGICRKFKISNRKKMFLSSISAFVFVIFTGASVSAIRAGVLCITGFFAKFIYRKADSLTTLSATAAMLSLVNPHCIYDLSFMLSFAATAGIILFYNSISSFFDFTYRKFERGTFWYKSIKGLFDSISVGIAAQVFVIPILVDVFQGFSLTSVIATVFVAFFLKYLLLGGIVFIILSFINGSIAYIVAGFVFFLVKILIFVAEFFAGIEYSDIIFGVVTPLLLILYGLFVSVFISLVKKKRTAYLISLTMLTVFSIVGLLNYYVNYNILTVSFINVGQGDCALIKAPGDCDILIDAGGYAQSGNSANVIAPYLISNGVTDVEYVIVSHTDTDHIVGIERMIESVDIYNIILPYGHQHTETGKELLKIAKEKNINIIYFTHGDKLKIDDDIILTAILPDYGQYMYAKNENDTGIVLKLDYGESEFLFTGDISSDIEKYALDKYPDMLEADVLKVAHHGSKFSTCQEFLEKIDADYAYIPVGKNTYGHPAPETLQRLDDAEMKVYRADKHKDVTFYADENGIKKVKYNKRIAEE